MSGRAASLPPFPNESPNHFPNDVELNIGEAEGLGRAVSLPPKSSSSHDMTCSFTEVSLHPKFGLLLKSKSSCKGARMLFKLDLQSFQVSAYCLKNQLLYMQSHNHIFIECTTFPQGSFKNIAESCLVCFKYDGISFFKVVC